ncbi:MAG: efflux RND transporter periplasmic adaptor subunit [Sphingomonadaceae bacterium]|nr:efflux RND transporter periplasmic adaptor subunit [Sphingomonadaceae bacterium]
MRGLGVAAALALAGCGAGAPPPAADDRVTIALATAAPAASRSDLAVSGTVRFKRETQLGFLTAGRIAAIAVREGDRVVAGQPLARLDVTSLDAAVASAKAEAVRAEADRRRMAALIVDGWVTRSRLESAESTAAAARARATQAGFDERLGRIAAPSAGVVLKRAAEPGQMVAAGAPVLTVGEVASGYVLRLPLSDAEVAGIRLGQPAEVVLPTLSSAPVEAVVSEIAARGDDRTGTFQVELRLPPRPGLRSGLIGTARLARQGSGGPVVIPASAVVGARADEGVVYVYRPDGTVAARVVQLGAVSDSAVAVTGGLAAGERVARIGVERLRDGMKVRLAA